MLARGFEEMISFPEAPPPPPTPTPEPPIISREWSSEGKFAQTPHTKVTGRAAQQSSTAATLEWLQKEGTPAASAKIESFSGSSGWQIKGFLLWDSFPASSGSSPDLEGLEFAHRCNTRYESRSHASSRSIHCQLCILREERVVRLQ